MLIKRDDITKILSAISVIEEQEDYPLTFKYIILKLKKILTEENNLNQQVLISLGERYGEITEDGEVRIKKENFDAAQEELKNFFNENISIEDIKIPLSMLTDKIKWEQLEALIPFITDEKGPA